MISLLFGSRLGKFWVKKFHPSQPRGEIIELFLAQNKEKVLKTRVFRTFCGGDKRDRTADLLNAIQALSQLSYTPIFGLPSISFRIIAIQRGFVKGGFKFFIKSSTFQVFYIDFAAGPLGGVNRTAKRVICQPRRCTGCAVKAGYIWLQERTGAAFQMWITLRRRRSFKLPRWRR